MLRCLIYWIDLKETLAPRSDGRDAAELRLAFEQLQDITRLMTTCNSIFIAAVRGWAVGGGAEVCFRSPYGVNLPLHFLLDCSRCRLRHCLSRCHLQVSRDYSRTCSNWRYK